MAKHLYIFVALVVLPGCGLRASERQVVAAFGQATAVYGAAYRDIVPEVRRSMREIYAVSLSLPTPESETAFRRADQRAFNQTLNQAVPPEREQLMVGLAEALADYGTALGELASYGDNATRTATLNKAASGFVTILNGEAAKQQTSLVGATVGFGGNQLFEAIRRQAVREIVIEAAPAVEQASALLRSSFALRGNAASLMVAYRQAIRDLNSRLPVPGGTYQLARERAFDLASSGRISDWSRLQAASEQRGALVQALALEADNTERLENFRSRGEAASEKLAKANATLVQTMRGGGEISMGDVIEFVAAASDLAAAVRTIRSGG